MGLELVLELDWNGGGEGCGVPLLLLCVYPSPPIVFQILCGVIQRGWPDGLAVTAPYQVDEQAVEEMRHVVLLLTCPALAKTLHKKNGL